MGFSYKEASDMEMWEALTFLQDRPLLLRDSYNQTRLQMLASLQPYSKKKLSVSDIIKYDWDEDEEEVQEVDISYLDKILKHN